MKLREILDIVLKLVLIICALLIASLWGINTFIKFDRLCKNQSKSMVIADSKFILKEVLPEDTEKLLNFFKREIFTKKKIIFGFPVAVEYSSIVKIRGNSMIFLPLIMDDNHITKEHFAMIEPLEWAKGSVHSCIIGRKSIWYMPKNKLMLYGILLEPHFQSGKIGVGYVLVKRISEDVYDVLLQNSDKTILYAARGRLVKINKEIGQGTLLPFENQEEVRKEYSPRLNFPPEEFILFCKGKCRKNN